MINNNTKCKNIQVLYPLVLDRKAILAHYRSMGTSFFSNLVSQFSGLFGSKDAGAEKKRLLKKINASLSQTKVKFYKYSSDEALPGIAKLFYEIYKVVGPAQIAFSNSKNPNYYKSMIMNYYLSDEQRDIEARLTEEGIFQMSHKIPLKELTNLVKEDLSTYTEGFPTEKIDEINSNYTKLTKFIDFCNFDYFFLLKKFDSTLLEANFNASPHFSTIRAEYITDDLKDFIDVAWALDFNSSWNNIFTILKDTLGVQHVTPEAWSKILLRLKKLNSLGVFEMMIQLIQKDPSYEPVIKQTYQNILDSQINSLKKTAEDALYKVTQQQKSSKIDDLLNTIYGTTNVVRLKYYNEDTNAMFHKKSMNGYTFAPPLNYLKAFLNDFFKKEVREFADLVLVRGQWVTSTLATPMSDTYHQLLGQSEKITAYDENLGEDGVIGTKIKNYLSRVDRERDARNILSTIIKEANTEAQVMIVESCKNLVIVAKNVKMLLEDTEKNSPEMLINWPQIMHYSDKPIKELGMEVYKKIFHFVSLMKFFLAKDD